MDDLHLLPPPLFLFAFFSPFPAVSLLVPLIFFLRLDSLSLSFSLLFLPARRPVIHEDAREGDSCAFRPRGAGSFAGRRTTRNHRTETVRVLRTIAINARYPARTGPVSLSAFWFFSYTQRAEMVASSSSSRSRVAFRLRFRIEENICYRTMRVRRKSRRPGTA